MQENMEQAVISPIEEEAPKAPSAPTDNEKTVSVGKFANSDELLKAYNHLEAEFTKKCQQLKETERRSATSSEPSTTEDAAPLYEKEDWDERVAAFLGKYPMAEEYANEIGAVLLEDKALAGREDCLDVALGRAVAKNYKKPESIVEDEAFLEKHVYKNDKIRNKIIQEYLEGLSPLVGAPRTLPHGGAAAIIPPSRPASIEEAGAMAEKLINSRRI